MSQKPIPPTDSVLLQYPLLRLRCQERRLSLNGAMPSIENGIADAVNGALACGSEGATVIIKHLATAFLYARALRQKEMT